MDLIREILLKVEELYVDTAINDLTIDGYDMATVAYHCVNAKMDLSHFG